MNIVIPMAGRGERFRLGGFDLPKPLIDVKGKPMVCAAIESLGIDGDYIFVVFDYYDNELNKNIKNSINSVVSDPKIISINYTTNGPASSVLLAKELIDNDKPLLVANCDQIMKWDSEKFLSKIHSQEYRINYDGLVVTYSSKTEKNSYVRVFRDKNGREIASEFAEKRVISEYSLNGIHFWNKGSLFVDSAEKMIKQNIRVNNEFYISETYNQLIKCGYKIGVWHIPKEQHCSIGTPEDLASYISALELQYI